LIPQERFDRLQSALDARAIQITNRSTNASPLLGVLVCEVCARSMHLRQYHKGKTLRYYHCNGNRADPHETNTIRAEQAEALVEEQFLDEIGDMKAQVRVYIPAENHTAELEDAVRAVDELTALLGTITSDTVRSRLLSQLGALDSRIAGLERVPAREARWEYKGMGQTYGELWSSSDTEERRQLMLRSGITVAVKVIRGTSSLVSDFRVPEDLRERLSA
jgi:site-specific DNA recombinase